MRILIVEDEQRLADSLRAIMERSNYIADVAYDGITGFDNAMSGIYDAVILDVMLPGRDGFSIVNEMRSRENATPVLLLTAKSELADRITGLDCGADYYLTKPFESEELLACVRAISRRQNDIAMDYLKYGDLSLALATMVLKCGHRSVRLGIKEFEIMRLLLINKRRIISKDTIIAKVWGVESDAIDNNVEVYISFLRKKLFHIRSAMAIATVRMAGYYLSGADMPTPP